MSFTCRQCGTCCQELLQRDMGLLRGLTLLPEETEQFDEGQVKPYFGIGKRPYDKDFKILAYQLTEPDCPHLIDNKCAIYSERPATCRQFPFSLDPDPDGGILLGVDMNCPAAVELVNNSTDSIDFPDRESALKIYELKRTVHLNPRKAWFYDLNSEKWVRYDRLESHDDV